MSVRIEVIKLQDGTLVRHKVAGYEGRIDGTTGIRACFTAGGESLGTRSTKETFQYRVAIAGESIRSIAPVEDLEILEEMEKIICPRCNSSFRTKPGLLDKPAGRCQCGGWICPFCLTCQVTTEDFALGGQSPCLQQRKRLAKKLALKKKRATG